MSTLRAQILAMARGKPFGQGWSGGSGLAPGGLENGSTNGLTADSLRCARVADNLVDHIASAVKGLIVAAAEGEVGGAVDRGGDGAAAAVFIPPAQNTVINMIKAMPILTGGQYHKHTLCILLLPFMVSIHLQQSIEVIYALAAFRAACSFASSSCEREVLRIFPPVPLISSSTLSGVAFLTRMKSTELPEFI